MALNIISNVQLDMKAPNTVIVYANQYDSAGSVRAQLLNSGESWAVPAGAKAVVMFKKSDKIGGFYDVTEFGVAAVEIDSDRSIIYINYDPQVLTTAGRVAVQINFYQNDQRLSSFAFYTDVQESAVTSGEIASSWLFNILSQEIAQTLTVATTPQAMTDWLEANITQETGYVIDNTLTVAGAASDAQATGKMVTVSNLNPNTVANKVWVKKTPAEIQIPTCEEVDELKSALSEIGLASSNVDFSQYSQITGTMQSNNIWGSFGQSSYKSTLITDIPIKMTVTALTTKNAYFSFFNKVPTQPASSTAEIYFCSGETGRHTVTMNTSENFVVPSDYKCIVVTTTSSGNDYTPKMVGLFMTSGVIEDIQSDIDGVKGDVNDLNVAVFNSEFAKAEALAKFTTVSNTFTNVAIGQTYESAKIASEGSTLVEIPCNGYATVRYPVFVTSQNLGSIFIDENGNVIGGNANKTASSGSYVEINIPLNAAKFILNIAPSISSMSWTVTLKHEDVNALKTKVDELKSALSQISDVENAIMEIGYSASLINFADYDTISGTISSNNQWQQFNQQSVSESYLITGSFYKIKVTAKSNRNAYISFFKSKPSQPTIDTQYIDFCNGETGRRMIAMDSSETFTVPMDCACIVVSHLINMHDYTPTIQAVTLSSFLQDIDSLDNDMFVKHGTFKLGYIKTNYDVGTEISLTPISSQSTQYCILDCSEGDYIVIKGRGGQSARFWAFVDQNNTLLSVAETDDFSEDKIILAAPENATKVISNQYAPSTQAYYIPSYIAIGFSATTLYEIESKSETNVITTSDTINRNMCLCGIKTDILDNKIPYARGYLFHKLQNNDNTLWYGTNFNKINKIGTVTFNPTLMRFAISPKDGRVIAVERDTRNGIWVLDGRTVTHIENFTSKPMAWLYNSGVDFIIDSDNIEHCIFAEYSSTVTDGFVLNVWRGTYPYTNASDWEVVMTQTQRTDINHFHMVRRDPWSNVLYLTSGDASAQSKWWYSTDYGATWSLLVSGSDTGWGNSLCRTINFIFTKDYIYWATDHGSSEHTLNRIQRDSETGIIDLATKEKITDLPALYATNSLCYVESPNGLFMYDRIDTESTSIFGGDITMKFWNFETEQLEDIATLSLTKNTWGGSRGKCYINYTNSKQTMPAMGFSIDTPCIFNLVCDNPANIGTITYDVGSKTIHTIDY